MRSVTSVNSNEGSGVEDVESDDPKLSSNVAWAPCQGDFPVKGKVSAFNISPCNRKNDSDINEPCEFSYGFNYTIKIDFTSELDAHQPRSSLIAGDSEEGPYAYSGQSFEACRYASCPIRANVKAVYTYRLRTLLSHFDSITFNVTQSIDGPSLFCAGTDISFQRPQ
ncbi:expressed protein [Phakopsora pachyrhizi]|nr:expressed protein [Phakopsora pachyrhizi]